MVWGLFEPALAEVGHGVVIAGPDRRIGYVNDPVLDLVGGARADLIGQTFDRLVDSERDPAAALQVLEALAAGQAFTAELPLRGPAGEAGRARLTITPARDGQDQLIGFVGVIREIAAPRDAPEDRLPVEDLYDQMFDHVQAGIVLHEASGALIYANPRAMELLGVSLDEVKGALLTDPHWVFVREDGSVMPVEEFPVSRALASGLKVSNLVIGIRRPDVERTNWVMGNAFPIFAADGAPTKVVVSFTDVTELKEAEQALALATRTAQAATEAKAQFLANMSHEIRTPLTGVLGYARMLREMDPLPAAALALIDKIEANGQILLSTVNDVLDFSRLEADRVSFTYLPTDVVDAFRGALRLFELDIAKKRLKLDLAVADTIPEEVCVDINRVRQILINLVANAIKFTPTGEVIVSLDFDPSDAMLRFEVRDTGIGIAPQNLPMLFERFNQVDVSTTRHFGGAGLGLAICRYLAERMGGRIRVDSTLGVGSRFIVDLPVRDPAIASPAGPDPFAAGAAALAGARILVIDDNAMIRDLTRRILEALGLEVETAVDGLDGVAKARTAEYDLFLIDRQMPGLGGESVAEQIRTLNGPNRTRPLIAFSADVIGELSPIFDGAVSKPIDIRHLALELSRHLSSPLKTAQSGDR